jgi:hypothetical protein
VNWEMLGVRPMGTPLILLFNQKGRIMKYWMGRLDPEAETDVINAIRQPLDVLHSPRRMPSGEPMFTETGIRAMSKNESVNIVNINEHGNFKRSDYSYKSINIPLDELGIRAKDELNLKELHFVDCTVIPASIFDKTISMLSQMGLRVYAMDDCMTDEVR